MINISISNESFVGNSGSVMVPPVQPCELLTVSRCHIYGHIYRVAPFFFSFSLSMPFKIHDDQLNYPDPGEEAFPPF